MTGWVDRFLWHVTECHKNAIDITGCGIFTGCGVGKTWNHRNHILSNRFCCFFCVRLTQPRSLGTGYFNSNLVGVRKNILSPPVSSLHLANSCATCLRTPLVLVHIPGENGFGAHHTGDIELRHCVVPPGNVPWERISKGPLCYCTLHANYITNFVRTLCMQGCERGTQYCKSCQPARAVQTIEPVIC